MGLQFYDFARDLLGTLPVGYDFVYVIFACLLCLSAIFLFLIVPIVIMNRIGG